MQEIHTNNICPFINFDDDKKITFFELSPIFSYCVIDQNSVCDAMRV